MSEAIRSTKEIDATPLPVPSEASSNDLAVVDPIRVEQQIDQKLIGERIRSMRLKRSMGLVELGRLSGLSASFLSQLETGRVVPTIRNLARIALVFEKDLSCFFSVEKKVTFRRLSKSDRIPITRKQKNSRFVSQSLSALIPDRHMVPRRISPQRRRVRVHPKGLSRYGVRVRP
jgi:transcriptional regulator with XRE-family HTH domain